MTLSGTSRLYKHQKARTLYLTIPSSIACDSQFGLKNGDSVVIENKKEYLIIRKKQT